MKDKITDEFGYWYKDSLLKNIMGTNVLINKENIDTLISKYKQDIQPHKGFLNKPYQEIVDFLFNLKIKMLW